MEDLPAQIPGSMSEKEDEKGEAAWTLEWQEYLRKVLLAYLVLIVQIIDIKLILHR